MADAGEVLLGPIGREVFGAAQIVMLIFVMASHLVTFTIMANVLSDHGTCSIIFGVCGAFLSFLFSLPRTLKRVSYLAMGSFISIIAALVITVVGVSTAPAHPHAVDLVVEQKMLPAGLALTNIAFAFAG